MKKSFSLLFLQAGLISLLVSGFVFHSVSAHQTITIGSYQVEVGWLDEPPVVGQRNAIVVNISSAGPTTTPASTGSATADAKPEPIDISNFKVEVVYGGETKTLTLQPLSEDSQGQYIAPILPTHPGKYTVRLSGKLGTTDANAEVQPEEVDLADSLQFPRAVDPAAQSGSSDLTLWLAGAGLLFGLAALGFSAFNLRKNRQ